MLYEEVDGRVGRVVSAYREMCVTMENRERENPFSNKDDIVKIIKEGPIDEMEHFPGSFSIPFVVRVQAFKGYMKVMKAKARKYEIRHFGLIQGAKELICHWIDRLAGFYRTPLVVKRNMYVSNFTCDDKHWDGKLCGNADKRPVFLDGMKASDVKFDPQYSKNIMFDQLMHRYYIDTAIIAEVKQLHLGHHLGRAFFPEKLNISTLFNQFFAHTLSFSELYKTVPISPQRLRDISDIHIMDFLTVNPNRIMKNWATSGTRLFMFDNGSSFDINVFKEYFTWSLYCIPILCKHIKPSDLAKANNFCRFNKDTVDKLRKVGPDAAPEKRLGYLLNMKIAGESWPFDVHDLLKVKHLNSSYTIDERVKLVLSHHEKCLTKFGESIYI